jgi:hypothetical protein
VSGFGPETRYSATDSSITPTFLSAISANDFGREPGVTRPTTWCWVLWYEGPQARPAGKIEAARERCGRRGAPVRRAASVDARRTVDDDELGFGFQLAREQVREIELEAGWQPLRVLEAGRGAVHREHDQIAGARDRCDRLGSPSHRREAER